MRALLLAAILSACAAPIDDDPPADAGAPDASTDIDAGPADAGTPDAFDACTGACRTPTLAFMKGSKRLPFTSGAFGLTPPDRNERGIWELYFEAWEGGFTGCPKNDSPTPRRTLVLSGVELPFTSVTRTFADGVRANIFDFEGAIVTGADPRTGATAVSVTVSHAHACEGAPPTCAEDERFVAIDIVATFGEGTLEGRLFAPHCASFDG